MTNFETSTLWGKDLFTHLQEVYEKRALFTVMFISEHYASKVWTNHDRQSAQARALASETEYILPAVFDERVKILGVLQATGRISLKGLGPEELAALIVEKLKESGVTLAGQFSYGEAATADVDFPRLKGDKISALIGEFRSYVWPQQKAALGTILELDWQTVTDNEIFVLGRNIYQSAVGAERSSISS
jgi:hypothetical protein